MPGLARKMKTCPLCGATELELVRTYTWTGTRSGGRCTELRCTGCSAALCREPGMRPMTSDQHAAWRATRQLPRAVLRRR